MTTEHEQHPPDSLDALAGEYVLGSLPAEQRAEVQRRLVHDAALRDAVAVWEKRLFELTDLVEPVQPAANLWQRIERSLNEFNHPAATRSAAAPRDSWWNLLPLWRALAGGGLAASLALALALLAGPVSGPSATTYLVVLVGPQDQTPGWVVQASGSRQIELIPLGDTAVPDDKALQFWTKADDWKGPVSLGLIKPGEKRSLTLDELPPLEPNQLFELTLENKTGSPTGKPTGPIQFIGRSVKVI